MTIFSIFLFFYCKYIHTSGSSECAAQDCLYSCHFQCNTPEVLTWPNCDFVLTAPPSLPSLTPHSDIWFVFHVSLMTVYKYYLGNILHVIHMSQKYCCIYICFLCFSDRYKYRPMLWSLTMWKSSVFLLILKNLV